MLAIELEGLVQVPVRLGLQQRDRVLHALAVALLEARENQIRRVDVAGADHVAELEAVGVELVDVARQEVAALPVEELEVALVDRVGHLVVDGGTAVVRLLEDASDLARGVALRVGGSDGPRRQERGARRRLDRGARECQRDERQGGRGDPSGRSAHR